MEALRGRSLRIASKRSSYRRQPIAVVGAATAERDRPIIRVTTSSRIPRRSRRPPPHNHQHTNSSQPQQDPEHSDNLEAKPKTTRDRQPTEASRFPFRSCPTRTDLVSLLDDASCSANAHRPNHVEINRSRYICFYE